MESFLEQADVEQCVAVWVHAATQCLQEEDLASDTHAPNDLLGFNSDYEGHAVEWIQVCCILFMHIHFSPIHEFM